MNQPTIGISISGLPAIDRKLAELEPKLQRKLIRQSLRKAAAPVLATAQARCRRRTGALAKSLKIRALKRSRKNKHVVGVRVVTGQEFFKGEQFYGGMIEFGAPGHKSWGRGSSPLAPEPFMRPAHDENKQTVRSVFRSELTDAVQEAAH